MTCCGETGCRRREPLRLYRGLTGRWLVATRTRDGAASAKHLLPDETQAELSAMADAYAWLTAIERAGYGRQQILDALGLEMKRPTG
jgi:hypothetical protein